MLKSDREQPFIAEATGFGWEFVVIENPIYYSNKTCYVLAD